MKPEGHRIRVEDYERRVGAASVERVLRKAEPPRAARVVHLNSTCYGRGAAEILLSLTRLLNDTGLRASRRIIQGPPDFFGIIMKMHDARHPDHYNSFETVYRFRPAA